VNDALHYDNSLHRGETRILNVGILKIENNKYMYFETKVILKNLFTTISEQYDLYFEINFENLVFESITSYTVLLVGPSAGNYSTRSFTGKLFHHVLYGHWITSFTDKLFYHVGPYSKQRTLLGL
jgi:hypothetical protein